MGLACIYGGIMTSLTHLILLFAHTINMFRVAYVKIKKSSKCVAYLNASESTLKISYTVGSYFSVLATPNMLYKQLLHLDSRQISEIQGNKD